MQRNSKHTALPTLAAFISELVDKADIAETVCNDTHLPVK